MLPSWVFGCLVGDYGFISCDLTCSLIESELPAGVPRVPRLSRRKGLERGVGLTE